MAGARLNKVFLIGRLTRDPELRYTPSGTAVADLGLAVDDDYTTQDGTRHERTVFVDVTVWGRQAETSCEYLGKGSLVCVEGRLRLDTWESNEGQKRSKLRVTAERVQFLGSPRREGEESGPPGGARPASAPGARPAPRPAPRPQPARPPRVVPPPPPDDEAPAAAEPEPDAGPEAEPPDEPASDIPF